MNPIRELDHELFAKINLDWTNGFFDWFFPAITDLHRNPWAIALLVVLLGFWFWKQRTHALKWMLVTLVCVSLSDVIAYRVVKSLVHRQRPEVAGLKVELRTHQHVGPSFPSNHAANMFAAATALSGGLPPLAPVFFTMAFLVSYSRVYVGVHFPVDVIGGALLGLAIGWTIRRLARRWLKPSSGKSASP